MVFNATFYNISVIPWQSILLMEETVVHRENYRPVSIHWQTLLHNVVSSTPDRFLNIGISILMFLHSITKCYVQIHIQYFITVSPHTNT